MVRIKKQIKGFQFPPLEEMERITKQTSVSNRRTNIGLVPNATPADRTKYELCKHVVRYRRQNKLSEEELTKQLGITQTKLEYILFCHIDKLTAEELINYVNKLHFPFEIKIVSGHDHQKNATKTY
ncbi:hypothetical protein C1645_861117 [Glomus cerebriforme]|uniref:HigA2-like helix-turn-helix domain-containing protein n=1 Tax=Glomus cerebriforme TaxID=658196 RepID=A0A397SH26_9GLOM|nr:hypothetical protein C1645_861117 [Glomus cerebriforme]